MWKKTVFSAGILEGGGGSARKRGGGGSSRDVMDVTPLNPCMAEYIKKSINFFLVRNRADKSILLLDQSTLIR
jgi:hypothetical protein